jgi:hypothetical protein
LLTLSVLLVVIGTAIWVDQDARKLVSAGATKTQLGGTSPIAWSIGTLLIWIIVFPWYVVKRAKVIRELGVSKNSPSSTVGSATQLAGPLPDLGWYVDPTNALQQRYWTGHAWTDDVRVAPPKQ